MVLRFSATFLTTCFYETLKRRIFIDLPVREEFMEGVDEFGMESAFSKSGERP